MIRWTKAKVRVFSDSVLCLVKLSDHSEANRRWDNQVQEFRQSNSCKELLGIDGELREFEWNVSRDLPHWRSSRRSRKICIETLNLKILKDESSSCQCSMTSNGQREEIRKFVLQIQKSQGVCEEILARTLDIPRPWRRIRWYGTLSYTPEGTWDSIASQKVERFKKSGHPVLKSISALSHGVLGRKNNRDTINFDADASNDSLRKPAQYLRSSLKLV